ncbi:hypothetical protein [Aquabacterium humicola]|uniref:hypothetical protein n=1 Tax=Aquabacterium humicola TaxID=3237377 RepID=UPI0025430B29|nr:hypothetical protein [Rubrivivax pictus]
MTFRIHSWLRRLALLMLAVPLGNAWALSATFDSARGVLTLPDVKVGTSTYVNVMLDLVDPATFTFRLREATLSQAAGSTNISFDAASGVLTIPEVTVGGDTYRATLAITDAATYTFVLSSATRIKQAALLSQLQAEVFTPRCSFCHTGGGSSLPAAMNLTAGNAFSNLVNVDSRQMSGAKRVVPGDAVNSYLIRKLEGTNIVGGRMPAGGPFLDADTIARIKSWIASGAPDN